MVAASEAVVAAAAGATGEGNTWKQEHEESVYSVLVKTLGFSRCLELASQVKPSASRDHRGSEGPCACQKRPQAKVSHVQLLAQLGL